MHQPGRYLSPAQTARRFGVSGKALRIYEAHGLVRPERTPADWRVYGPEQIARLQQVMALKSFGLSLGRIAELLSGRCGDLGEFLALHEGLLRRQQAEVDQALRLVVAARARLAADDGFSSNDLIDLTRKTAMTNSRDLKADYEAIIAKYLTPKDRATLKANGYDSMDKPNADWNSLNAEATALMSGHAPDSAEAMDLARRWMAQVDLATGGKTELNLKVRDLSRDLLQRPDYAAQSPSSLAIMDYIGRAYGAAIAAGIMPKPR